MRVLRREPKPHPHLQRGHVRLGHVGRLVGVLGLWRVHPRRHPRRELRPLLATGLRGRLPLEQLSTSTRLRVRVGRGIELAVLRWQPVAVLLAKHLPLEHGLRALQRMRLLTHDGASPLFRSVPR